MLDHQYRHAGLPERHDEIAQRLALVAHQPRRRFIQKQHLRFGGERRGDHEKALLRGGDAGDGSIGHGRERGHLEDFGDPGRNGLVLAGVTPDAKDRRQRVRRERGVAAQLDLFANSELGEDAGSLKGARKSHRHPLVFRHGLDMPAREQDLARGHRKHARKRVHCGGFA